jgi:hypothetical protein
MQDFTLSLPPDAATDALLIARARSTDGTIEQRRRRLLLSVGVTNQTLLQ